ncbi:MAG: hypothetical protein WBL50_14330 [Candidatus Acidiferrum sp.]
MGKIVTTGQFLFAVAIVALGIENLICAHFGLADAGVAWFPVNPLLGYINGIALSAAGLSIAAKFHSRLAAMLLGYLFLGYVLFLELPLVAAHPADWTAYGVLFEALALGAAAWTLAHTLTGASSRWESVLAKATVSGPYLFAVCLVVFGSIHFVVARFIASLIPAWIPGSLFWAYLTGTALIAAGISIAIQRLDQWAGSLLGVMFLLWVVLLHSARVAADLHNADEWSSALIALAMCGGSWIVANHARRAK